MSSLLNGTSGSGSAQTKQGISFLTFLTALSSSVAIFGVQTLLFLVLRGKLARIFRPKTYLVPERERTEPPPDSPWGMIQALFKFRDREIIKKCGLDAYFFLRYLQTLLLIFVPIALIVIPILVPINYSGGKSQDFVTNSTNSTSSSDHPSGLDTLAWGNVKAEHVNRYWAHLILAILVILWVCGVFFSELRIYIKVRQDYLTTAEHRLRASATTVMVNSVPEKWLTEDALRGLFDVFPGGIRNIWLTRDLTKLLDKIKKRDEVHQQLEDAQTELIRESKRRQLKKREKDEKAARKASKTKGPTKEEKAERDQREDAAAKRRAESGAGASSGDQTVVVPHTVPEAVEESLEVHDNQAEPRPSEDRAFAIPGLGIGLSKLTYGLGWGVDVVGRAGQGVVGGAKNVAGQLDSSLETTNGFVPIGPSTSRPPTRNSEAQHVQLPDDESLPRPSTQGTDFRRQLPTASAGRVSHSHHGSEVSQVSTLNRGQDIELKQFVNTTRKMPNLDAMYEHDTHRWYQFWKPPPGGFASPVPQGFQKSELPSEEKSFWQKAKSWIPFCGDEEAPVEYDKAFDQDYDTQAKEEGAEWQKWFNKSHRPTHRLPIFEWTPGWLPGLPFLNKKVDTIYWCRQELARLNLEIESDQRHPERYPLMNSAFIQFNHQVAAHMACQSVTHHIPRHMSPRTVEISPNDVIWDNMAISWWVEWLRTGLVLAVVVGMIILWAIPVAFTSTLSQVTNITNTFPWLGFLLDDPIITKAAQALAGVLPALLIGLLLILVPLIMDFLASLKGAKTGSQKAETVQQFYFAFLFVQITLVVSLTSGALSTINKLLQEPESVANVLATNLPASANYFFSYMILQAMSTSSGTLLQIGALLGWYVIAKITNNTARNKWTTNTKLPSVRWGSHFPVYTNFACIGLIYSIVAPIISIFAIITFSLLWIANRYAMLYVNRFTIDTGGVLYPRAINQTFTGLYVMEICLTGLFFIVKDTEGNTACITQGIIMIVATVLTGFYQILLNKSFGPLFRYLPITFEDEAVLRDEAFQRAQDHRLGLVEDENETGMYEKDGASAHRSINHGHSENVDTGDSGQRRGHKVTHSKTVKGLAQAGSWAVRGGKAIKDKTYGKAEQGVKSATKYRNDRRQKDIESQRAIGEALYGGFHDEIEDLTPEERDMLVQRAFMHSALRARRPTVWIPRDDNGVSDDEVRRTREFSDYIWISNEGTALDSKVRVVYGRAPPDFSEVDLINL